MESLPFKPGIIVPHSPCGNTANTWASLSYSVHGGNFRATAKFQKMLGVQRSPASRRTCTGLPDVVAETAPSSA
jgi:hypothetical protein